MAVIAQVWTEGRGPASLSTPDNFCLRRSLLCAIVLCVATMNGLPVASAAGAHDEGIVRDRCWQVRRRRNLRTRDAERQKQKQEQEQRRRVWPAAKSAARA
ncbi:hypothetical protein CMUS01_06155 [Colletotrichum musicola]|uniref:Uncharacterized protein n=1 Tax=Colletotrichum musicola TaxID=2175873 RepID=A0A8H6KNE3_9PEZI|nr:hypothetical protein CMUS01_06155 [Colletotrichum musicola]